MIFAICPKCQKRRLWVGKQSFILKKEGLKGGDGRAIPNLRLTSEGVMCRKCLLEVQNKI